MEQYQKFIAYYEDYYTGWVDKLSEYVIELDSVRDISYEDAEPAINLIKTYYDNISFNICDDTSNYGNYFLNSFELGEQNTQYECNDNKFVINGIELYSYQKLQEIMNFLKNNNRDQETYDEYSLLEEEISESSTSSEEDFEFFNDSIQTENIQQNVQESTQYNEFCSSYVKNYTELLNQLSEHIQVLDKMKHISYREVREVIELIDTYYKNIFNDIFDNNRFNIYNNIIFANNFR